MHQHRRERTVADMPYDNSESKTKRPRSPRALQLVVAGVVAVAPVAGCDNAAKPATDASSQKDVSGSPDGADAGADVVATMDSAPAVDAEDDANLDVYPDGIRG